MIYTIGHSNHSARRFIDLLQGAGIDCVADVRSTPFSRRNPQFSQKALAASLKDAGIEYWFLGDALGARPKDPHCWESGKVSYARIAASPAFQEAIHALIEESHAAHRPHVRRRSRRSYRTILIGQRSRSATPSLPIFSPTDGSKSGLLERGCCTSPGRSTCFPAAMWLLHAPMTSAAS